MFWFARRGLRVLMYHKVSAAGGDELTVTVAQLEQQMAWLRARGAAFVTLAQLIEATEGRARLPPWPVLVTFDDGYRDTLELALPVLQRHAAPAAVFVPTAFVGRTSAWDRDARPLMCASELHAIVAAGWEIALHSHRHVNFATLETAQIADEVRENFAAFRALRITAVAALAYPYGGRPHRAVAAGAMRNVLREGGVRVAFRIGNRVNALPLRDRFEVNRLGVRGDVSFEAFQRKIRWGKLL